MKLENVMNNPYVSLALAIITVVSVMFSFITWYKGKEKKQFTYLKRSYMVLMNGKDSFPGLKLSYKGKEIDSLVITKYVIWNSGNKVLESTHFAKTDPLEIKSIDENARILEASIIEKTQESNLFNVLEKTEKCIKLSFDYADVKDGIILQIMHTGESDAIDLRGTIKGGKIVKLSENLADAVKTENIGRNYLRKGLLVFLTLTFSSFLPMLLEYFGVIPMRPIEEQKTVGNNVVFLSPPKNISEWVIGIFFAAFGVACSAFCIYIILRKDNYINIPKKFREKIKDDILKFK